MLENRIAEDAIKFAEQEIEKYGLPTRIHFELSLNKGKEISEALKADKNLVIVGICLMDIKLGEAFSKKIQSEHVQLSMEAGKNFLKTYGLGGELENKIINCIEAHHGKISFRSLESEIVANSDCYRFIHPTGVIHYIGTLTKRGLDFNKILDGVESKLDEKKSIVSLNYCKEELDGYYSQFKELIAKARL